MTYEQLRPMSDKNAAAGRLLRVHVEGDRPDPYAVGRYGSWRTQEDRKASCNPAIDFTRGDE